MMQNQRLGPLLARAAAVQNMAAALPAAPAPQQPGLDVSESKAGLGIDFGPDALLRSLGAAPGVTAGACVAGAITRREALTGASSAKCDEKHGCSARAKGKGRD